MMSAPPAVVNSSTIQLIKTDRGKLTLIDEESMMKRIKATHHPEHFPEFNVRDLLDFTETIFSLAAETKENPSLAKIKNITSFQALRYVADSISSKIRHKEWGQGNEEETTVSLFKMLSRYSWEAKLVVAVAAFSLNYGESRLFAQAYSSNPLASKFFQMLRWPFILAFTETSESQFNELVKVMMDVTKCVVDFKELPSIYISSTEVPEYTEAFASIPTAVYRIISSIVVCVSWINNFPDFTNQPATSTPWDLAKLQDTHKLLKAKLDTCRTHIEENRNDEAYIMLLNLYDKSSGDNLTLLKAFVDLTDHELPLFDGATRRRASLGMLRNKTTLVLISRAYACYDELVFLEVVYGESRARVARESQFEVVWILIVDRSSSTSDDLNNNPWYTVNPYMVNKAATRFIREVWHFKDKPILVVVDSKGNVASPNAFPLICIWGSAAFPFSTSTEISLWKKESWRLDFLIDIDQVILDWIKEGKFIFLYGGDDIDWIRKFTTEAKRVTHEASLALEMAYMGKRTTERSKVRKVIETITNEKLSYTLYEDIVRLFWLRVESMFISKVQLQENDERDQIMQETKRLLSYNEKGSWALLSNGYNVVVNGRGSTVMKTLMEYNKWKEQVVDKGFDIAFRDYHDELSRDPSHCCCQFDFPTTSTRIPERFACPHCSRAMEKYVAFSCCNHAHININLGTE